MIQYIESARRQFDTYKTLGEKAMLQMTDEALNWQQNEDSNSVAGIVKHMRGNMLSRWTDFLTTDGEKPWRERDTEFEYRVMSRQEMMNEWEEGWACLRAALSSITNDDLQETIYIRGEGHSVLEAINRQVAHYSYHVGQIVYIAKLTATNGWNSLSIPRDKSAEYNEVKFKAGK